MEFTVGDYGTEDWVGYWESPEYQLCCFPTIESIPAIKEIINSNIDLDNGKLFVLINQNFFIDPLTAATSKTFVNSLDTVYKLENINAKGVGGLSVRGLLYGKYPGDISIARRLDVGGYEVIGSTSGSDRKSTR